MRDPDNIRHLSTEELFRRRGDRLQHKRMLAASLILLAILLVVSFFSEASAQPVGAETVYVHPGFGRHTTYLGPRGTRTYVQHYGHGGYYGYGGYGYGGCCYNRPFAEGYQMGRDLRTIFGAFGGREKTQ